MVPPRLLAGALTLLGADGDHTFFLFADQVPDLYQRQGFVPLPAAYQRRQGSICMVRTALLVYRPNQLGK